MLRQDLRELKLYAATLAWALFGLLVAGAIVGWALAKAGYGARGPKYSPKQH